MAFNPAPFLNCQQIDANGNPLSGGKIETYLAGSSTPATTFKNAAGSANHTNPIILNVRGEPDSPIYLQSGILYKFIRKDALDAVIGLPLDNIEGINDTTTTADQYQVFGGVATYISATSFSLVGDQTSTFEKGRAIKLLTSGGTVFAKILSSTFTTLTTVVIELATGNLDTGITGTSPSYGVLSAINNALPATIDTRAQNQSAIAFTTTGTSTAYVGTPSPAISALADKQKWNVEFNVTAGVTPTLAINGTAAKAIKKYNDVGALVNIGATDVIANMISDVEYSLSDDCYILLNPLPLPRLGAYLGTVYYTCTSQALTSISNASPAVLTSTSARLTPQNFAPIQLTTSGTLPTGLSLATTYYVFNSSGTTFNVAASMANAIAGTAVNTSSAGSGTHTAASAPYVKATGVFGVPSFIEVEAIGGGAGSGGCTTTAGTASGGGGAGGYAKRRLAASALAASEAIVIGDGGAGGANTGGTGTNGGNTTFGSLITCNGGTASVGATSNTSRAGGAGGTATGGDVNFAGMGGMPVISTQGGAGIGGFTIFGGNAALPATQVTHLPPDAPKNTGNGANGSQGAGTAQIGGQGASGIVIIAEYS